MRTHLGWRSAARAALRIVVVLASAGVLVIAATAWSIQYRVHNALVTSDAVTPAVPVTPGQAFTALLVGLDARTDAAGNPLPQPLLDAMHAGPDEGELHTDTIIVLHVSGDPDVAPVAISIPRDSFVPIAGGRGTHKINSAYGRGLREAEDTLAAQGVTGSELDRRGREAGRAVLVATVANLTGLTIDHFAEINLAGFLELTEELGGVPVCLTAPARDSYSGIDLPAGQQIVSGASALAFVRQRHGLDGGDLDRIARQQAFLAGLIQRLRATGTLSIPARLDSLAAIITRYVVLDRSWDVQQLLTQVQTLPLDELTLRTIPTGRPDLRTPVDGVAVQVDPEAVRAFATAVVTGMPVPGGTPTSTPTSTPIAAPPTSAATTTAPRVITADGVPCVS